MDRRKFVAAATAAGAASLPGMNKIVVSPKAAGQNEFLEMRQYEVAFRGKY